MQLEFGKPTGGLSFLPGTIINTPIVVSAVDISKQDVFNNGSPIDVGIEVTLDIGKSWQPKWRIYGHLKEKNGMLTWGSAFRVRDFLAALGAVGTLTEDGHIPQEVLDQLAGKQFVRLSYVSGFDGNTQKRRYRDFTFIETVKDFTNQAELERAGRKLTDRFQKDVAAGYTKDFNPEAGSNQQGVPTFP